MCCGGKMCMLCTCVILVVILIGMLFGFGVFKDGFHKIKDTIHDCDPSAAAAVNLCGRKGLSAGFAVPPEALMRKYTRARPNLAELEVLGCTLIHGVDVHTMRRHGILQWMHQKVVRGFLRNAKEMLEENGGEIHITHKTSHPYTLWEIETLAHIEGLRLLGKVPFLKWQYPGYDNKRGDGSLSDNTFSVEECSTFKFGK